MNLKTTIGVACVVLGGCVGVATAAPVQWLSADGGNDHWYDFQVLDTATTASDAEAMAEASVLNGESGYLATITSAAEQSFLNALWSVQPAITGQFNDLSYYLIGASDRDVENTFRWIGGPEDGDALSYVNWSGGEPNNSGMPGGNEDYVVGWWNNSAGGQWNDIPGSSVLGVLVEYNDAQTAPPVPLPAAGWMLLAGIGGLAALRRRRKA